MSRGLYLALPLTAGLAVVQTTLLPHFRLLGVAPSLLLVAAVAWGLVYGLSDGLLLAAAGGLLADLFSAGPLGASALALMAAVALAVAIQRLFPDSRFLLPVGMAALATVVFYLAYLLLVRILAPLIAGRLDYLPVSLLLDNPAYPGLQARIGAYYGLAAGNARLILLAAISHSLLLIPFHAAFYALGRAFRPRQVEI
ncbi:MAG: rod shape-determining protein MreD [Candidatus Promineifilaceae bacterium]